MRHPVERHQVVLAGAVDLDVLDQHELVVADVERRGEGVLRTFVQPGEDLGVSAGDAGRRLLQTLALGVLAHGEQELADRGLRPVVVERRDGPVRVVGQSDPIDHG